MKFEMRLCGDTPLIETDGNDFLMHISDVHGTTGVIRMSRSTGYCIEQGLLEKRTDSKSEMNLHPVFDGILKRFEEGPA